MRSTRTWNCHYEYTRHEHSGSKCALYPGIIVKSLEASLRRMQTRKRARHSFLSHISPASVFIHFTLGGSGRSYSSLWWMTCEWVSYSEEPNSGRASNRVTDSRRRCRSVVLIKQRHAYKVRSNFMTSLLMKNSMDDHRRQKLISRMNKLRRTSP